MITALTPTCGRPLAFALCERYMARQTVKPDEWVVADGGMTPVACRMGQRHIWHPRAPGAANLTSNLLAGLAAARGDVIIIIEDDDHYSPTHIETMVGSLHSSLLAVGDPRLRYYNVAQRCWRLMTNAGSSLCQTAIRRGALGMLERAVRGCAAANSYAIDLAFWRAVPRARTSLANHQTVVGIKGLPGTAGLGVGHRPDARWTTDPNLEKLRGWVGQDVETYAAFALSEASV